MDSALESHVGELCRGMWMERQANEEVCRQCGNEINVKTNVQRCTHCRMVCLYGVKVGTDQG